MKVNIDSEGADKEDMSLPYEQDELIKRLLEVNPNTIIVMTNGAPVDMSGWINNTKSLIHTSYNGMEGGRALAEVIFGEVNPSGKLAVTYPVKLEDSPAHSIGEFPGGKTVKYTEGLYVGYRHFVTRDVKPLFEFGYGLSYTSFKYDDLTIKHIDENGENKTVVTYKITNTGNRKGAEISQVYVQDIESSVDRPLYELKGFDKVFLEPGESKEVKVTLNERAFAFYSTDFNSWKVEPGEFNILVGSSVTNIKLSGKITINNEVLFK